MNYIIPISSINKFSEKIFSKYSLSAKDYRKLLFINTNWIKLKNLLEEKPKFGKEIGSDSYMAKSKYRFLKTVNISNSFLLKETNIEYCIPRNNIFPKKNEILIVKDGVANGLGETCIYPHENRDNLDSISAGIISIKVNENKIYYVFGMLKSQNFKDYIDLNTAQGSTIRHSKRVSLDYKIPFPTSKNNENPKNVERLVSLIVQNIIDKEEQIKSKKYFIDKIIEQELWENQKKNKYSYSYPKISEIKKNARLDTGLYERNFKKIDFLIENYNNGYFQIPIENFKSGSTPSVRIINPKKKNFKWVTPTNIFDEGFLNPILTINTPTKNNINKDCVLIINRTSKGKKGEYVGISCFYDFSFYGKGQHNQGLYQIKNYNRIKSLFLVSLLNSKIFRKVCGYVCIGSKMKEMKATNFANLKFPNFPEVKQKEIASLYYNELNNNIDLSFDNYLQKEKERNQKIGIFQLNIEIFRLKNILDNLIHKIVMEEKIIIDSEY